MSQNLKNVSKFKKTYFKSISFNFNALYFKPIINGLLECISHGFLANVDCFFWKFWQRRCFSWVLFNLSGISVCLARRWYACYSFWVHLTDFIFCGSEWHFDRQCQWARGQSSQTLWTMGSWHFTLSGQRNRCLVDLMSQRVFSVTSNCLLWRDRVLKDRPSIDKCPSCRNSCCYARYLDNATFYHFSEECQVLYSLECFIWLYRHMKKCKTYSGRVGLLEWAYFGS